MISSKEAHRRTAGGVWLDLLMTGGVWFMAASVSVVFIWILFDIVLAGLPAISWGFLTESPRNAGREGGIGPIIVSTWMVLGVAMGASLPLGLGTAILLSDIAPVESPFGRLVRRSLDVLAGVPSIVFGLFGNAIFCIHLGMGFSILSGGLTLACMVLPIFIRATEEGIRSVPESYRLGAASLGMSRSSIWVHLILPAAVPGMIVGLVLGIGRALAETAALVFTSGYVDRMPSSLWDSGRVLSVHVFDLSMNVAGGDRNAYGTALVLLVMLLLINSLVSWIVHRWQHTQIIAT